MYYMHGIVVWFSKRRTRYFSSYEPNKYYFIPWKKLPKDIRVAICSAKKNKRGLY